MCFSASSKCFTIYDIDKSSELNAYEILQVSLIVSLRYYANSIGYPSEHVRFKVACLVRQSLSVQADASIVHSCIIVSTVGWT